LAADLNVANHIDTIAPKTGTAELLFRCAEQMGLQPAWIASNGLFVITCNGREHYINFARSPLNTHTNASLSRNKHATRLILERNGLPNIPFLKPQTIGEAEEFLRTHAKIIAKPASGSGAHDIHIITHPAELKQLHIKNYILEKYIAGKEMRYLVLQGRVIGVHQSEYGTSIDEHRALKRISYPKSKWDKTLAELAVKVSAALGLQFVAVDYLVNSEGYSVLEVNTAPGLKWFHAPSSGPVVDVARQFLEAVVANATPRSSSDLRAA